MKEKYYERLKRLAKYPNSSILMWGYEASAILKEIERLNNIIEQTQKILYIKLMNENKEKIYIQEVIDIIENLKGSDKEWKNWFIN